MENLNSRKGKALLFLPLLIIPFLTLAFWALGGGKGEGENQTVSEGLNLQLPNPRVKDLKDETKLTFYQTAEKDSAKIREEIKNDPLFQESFLDDSVLLDDTDSFSFKSIPDEMANYSDPNEQKVYRKLRELNRQLHTNNTKISTPEISQDEEASYNEDGVDRLENLMQNMHKDSANDPELSQLNSMMEKILDIQHPERVKARSVSKESNNEIFKIAKVGEHASVTLLDTVMQEGNEDGFFGLEDTNNFKEQNAIEALIHENQTIVSGSVIKMRLLNDIYINGDLITKGNFIYGISTISGERLQIQINSIKCGQSLYPVHLEVYDMDGLPGIYIPGAITRDAAKQSYERSLQSINMSSFDPSVKAQLTTAGIDAAKNLMSRKAKQIKVFVKAGYRILLRQKTINNN
jgi:conjugative transposon TraM protein